MNNKESVMADSGEKVLQGNRKEILEHKEGNERLNERNTYL